MPDRTSESESQAEASPWLSRNNRADAENHRQSGQDDESDRTYHHIAKELVRDAEADLEGRIFRALSVSGDTKLRLEAVRERRGEPGSYRAKAVAGAMKAFLTWFLNQEDLVLKFDGFEIDAACSYDEDAARERYGRLADFERGALEAVRRTGDELYTALLAITASHENADGNYRCPADFWREMRESWNGPVRREMQRVFKQLGAKRFDPEDPPERWWEYLRVVEPHGSGYGHHHIVVVTNFDISAETFEPMIARHVETTPSANWQAHQLDAEDPEDQCVTVNRVDPEEDDASDVVGNLASYLSSYLSDFDENGEWIPMLEKPAHKIMFYATCWSMNVRRIDFSNGGHALKRLGHENRPEEYKRRENDEDVPTPIAIGDSRTGEEYPIGEPRGVRMVNVDDEPEKDPEKVFR